MEKIAFIKSNSLFVVIHLFSFSLFFDRYNCWYNCGLLRFCRQQIALKILLFCFSFCSLLCVSLKYFTFEKKKQHLFEISRFIPVDLPNLLCVIDRFDDDGINTSIFRLYIYLNASLSRQEKVAVKRNDIHKIWKEKKQIPQKQWFCEGCEHVKWPTWNRPTQTITQKKTQPTHCHYLKHKVFCLYNSFVPPLPTSNFQRPILDCFDRIDLQYNYNFNCQHFKYHFILCIPRLVSL